MLHRSYLKCSELWKGYHPALFAGSWVTIMSVLVVGNPMGVPTDARRVVALDNQVLKLLLRTLAAPETLAPHCEHMRSPV